MMMRVIEISRYGDPEVLRLAERPIPEPGTGEVLIRVIAAGINRPDLMQRKGFYPPPVGVTDIPGLELAGDVVALGAEVDTLKIGDRVCALVAGGAYAEYATAHAELCLPIPGRLPPEEAAALPETLFTVWSNLFERGNLQTGERLLIHGGSGGIGSMALQLAREWGVEAYATASSPDKCRFCADLGATPIPYRQEDFASRILQLTEGQGVDVILDSMGGDYLQRNLDCLAVEGRLLLIGVQLGPKTHINLLPILLKRQRLIGSTLRPRSLKDKAQIARALSEHVWPLLEAGRVRPMMDQIYPLSEVVEAHRRMEHSLHKGKMVLLMNS